MRRAMLGSLLATSTVVVAMGLVARRVPFVALLAAAVAILSTGAPEGYVSPVLLGEEVTPDESGLSPLFAVPTQYGSLAAIPITIGALDENGIRETFSVETPAANSFVYEGETCDA